MDIEFNNLSLSKAYSLSKKVGTDILESSFYSIIAKIEMADAMTKRSKLTNEEYVSNLQDLFYFAYDENDLLTIISYAHDKMFDKFAEIKTTTYLKGVNHKYGVTLFCVLANDFDINPDKYYSSEEIENLVNEHRIGVISVKAKELYTEKENKLYSEEYQDTPLIGCNFNNFDGKPKSLLDYWWHLDEKYTHAFILYTAIKLKRDIIISKIKDELKRVNHEYQQINYYGDRTCQKMNCARKLINLTNKYIKET